LARFVDRVQALTDYDAGVTVNVGLIRGGSSANTVPAEATCAADVRFVRAVDGEAVVAACERAAAEISAASGARIEVSARIARMPIERTEASAALCQAYGACAIAAGLGAGEAALVGGGSDANTVS